MELNIFDTKLYNDLLAVAASNGIQVYENELNLIKNLPVHVEEKITTKKIFSLYWPKFKSVYSGKIRNSIVENVEAMINCKDLSKGYLFYECTNCDNYHMTGFSCHSRFCTSCGKKYRDSRSINIQKKILDVGHRHFVFSVPFDLRPFFWKCRELFDILFEAVKKSFDLTLKLSKKDKRANYQVGYAAFLHTSGRSLNAHPHLHILLAERMVDKDGNHKNIHFFPFTRLKLTFMYLFLDLASKALKRNGDKVLYNDFQRLRSKIINKYSKGFYIYGPANKNDKSHIKSAKGAADYITRYASHPPLAESNILDLDDFSDTVTWSYVPHETPNETIIVKEHVFSFMGKLIRHIPDKGFHTLRYYGFYANRASHRIKRKRRLFDRNRLNEMKKNTKWRIMIKNTYKYDPLLCRCGTIMKLNIDSSYFGKYDWRDFND